MQFFQFRAALLLSLPALMSLPAAGAPVIRAGDEFSCRGFENFGRTAREVPELRKTCVVTRRNFCYPIENPGSIGHELPDDDRGCLICEAGFGRFKEHNRADYTFRLRVEVKGNQPANGGNFSFELRPEAHGLARQRAYGVRTEDFLHGNTVLDHEKTSEYFRNATGIDGFTAACEHRPAS